MKRIFVLYLLTVVYVMAFSQTKILLTVGDRTMSATLVENAATEELVSLLQNGPVAIVMNDYGGFEKVGALPQSLPTSNSQITTEPGDIMLYQGNNMVIFYGTNTWSYTRLGKIEGATRESVKDFLGNGEISLSISLDMSTGVESNFVDDKSIDSVYDISGNKVKEYPNRAGIYVINGKKTIVK